MLLGLSARFRLIIATSLQVCYMRAHRYWDTLVITMMGNLIES
jgi:hypothetical protein